MNASQITTPEGTALYLRTLPAIRERCGRVHALATQGKLEYFDYHPEKEGDVAAFCIDVIQVLCFMHTVMLQCELVARSAVESKLICRLSSVISVITTRR